MLIGRSISLGADLVTILLIHRLTGQVGARRWAWFAALAYAVGVVPVGQAHMALPDSLMTMLATAVVWRSWCVLEGEGRWRDYLMAGALSGLVLATKYNGALCALAVVCVHLLRGSETTAWRRLLQLQLWGAGLVAVIAAVVACPYFLLEPGSHLGLARYQLSSLDFAMRDTSPWWWVAKQFVLREYVLGGLMLAGLVQAAGRRDRFDWVVLAVVLPYVPILVVQVSRLLQDVAHRVRPPAVWLPVAAACLLLVPNAVTSLRGALDLRRPDTRSLAAEWIEANIPDGSGIGMTWLPYCPRLQSIAARRGLEAAYYNRPVALGPLQSLWERRPATPS